MFTLSFNDNESLMKISGGDLALFEKSARDFLAVASASQDTMPEPKIILRDTTPLAKNEGPVLDAEI